MSSKRKKKKGKSVKHRNAGAKFGSHAGSYLGGMLGGAAHNWFKAVTGYGEYTVTGNGIQHNSLMGPLNRQVQVPFMHPEDHMGITRITKREYLRDVVGTTTLTYDKILISPGDELNFPWLSNIAQRYQQYVMLGMVVEYVPYTYGAPSGTSTSSVAGVLAMTCNYDQEEWMPNTLLEVMNNFQAISGRPSDSMMLPIECDPRLSHPMPMPVRGRRLHNDFDGYENVRDNVFGEVVMAIDKCPTTGWIGQLWVTYDILLLKPCEPERNRPDSVSKPLPILHPSPGELELLFKDAPQFQWATPKGQELILKYRSRNVGEEERKESESVDDWRL